MAVINPVTVGVAVKYVGAAWNILSAGGGLNREQREAIEAARQAGYSTGVRGYRDPQGRVVSQKEVLRAGRAAQIALPDAPGSRPSDPGYRPDLTEKRIPPLRRDPPPKVPKVPKIPGRAGRIVDTAVAVAGGTGIFEIIRGGIDLVRERTPTQPAAQLPPPPTLSAPPGASYPEIAGPRPPFLAPPAPKQPPPPPVAQLPRTPTPAPGPPAPFDTEGLSPINVYVPYASIPAAPAPSGSSAAAPRTVLGMSPAQLASLAVPTLLALLAGGSSRSRRRDPLTVPQTPALPGLPTIPGLGLTPGGFPLPFPGGSFSGGGGGSSSGQCECPPKRKKGPPKRRTVCYSGRYIERASGLSKTKLRKVQCR